MRAADSRTRLLMYVLLIAALSGTFVFSLWHRTQVSMEYLDGRFTGYDPYIYFRQAERIVEEGRLPERDMERWLPMGRDLSLLHNLYSYVLAYSYRAARVVFPELTLYDFCCYAPPVLLAITASLFAAMLWSLFGWEAAGLGSLFFLFNPFIAFRTSLGFADRDAFCLFLGVLTGSLYLWQVHASVRRNRIILASTCGLTAALGCLGWEGSGVFALCVLLPATVRAWGKQERILEHAVFCGCLTMPLLLLSSTHRFWIARAEPAHPIGLVAVYPALLAMSLVLIRQAYRMRWRFVWRLSAFLPAASLLIFLARRAASTDSALSFAVPFSNSRLMQIIPETHNMTLAEWHAGFGVLPIIVAVGILIFWIIWRKRGASAPHKVNASASFDALLFGTVWIILWGFLTQISLRYSVMLAPAMVAWGGVILARAGVFLAERFGKNGFSEEIARYIPTTLIPAAVLFWQFFGGLVFQSADAAQPDYAHPSDKVTQAMRWMSSNLDRREEHPVVAADWIFGVHLNVLADAATINDTDTWKHYWIHLVSRHLYCAESETEALQFLKTRNAHYWMLVYSNITGQAVRTIEYLAYGLSEDRTILFARRMWNDGSDAFELVYENDDVKIFRIHYPPDLIVPPELYEAWTAPNFPDPELRRVWMGG